jgi:diguanylate cyclase (GGDEF)-like protein
MHLKRFNEFVRELRDDRSLKASVNAVEVVRRFQGTWYRDDGAAITDERLIRNLKLTCELNAPWRRQNATSAFFPVSSLDAVVVAVFQRSPTRATRERVQEQILACLKRCSDSYRARHDELTELLNRPAFDAILVERLRQFRITVPIPSGAQEEDAPLFTSIILLTLDIDFFKRVNDSYGHSYGDLVLRSFAIRLERASELLEQDDRYDISAWCARPSGEEFAVLLAGNITPNAELEIAERLHAAMVSRPLPDDAELSAMVGDPRLSEITLPPLTERNITPSIGLSSRHSGITPADPATATERLKVEADLALYRAKALGRNRCVRFSDIVHKHGQVIQHHVDVDVVAIDLGEQVGVSLGQEFLVFHPDFIGSKPFLFGDGRTERKLGDYPRVPYGRLEVFDVQLEISFSYVAEKRGTAQFPVGARVEAVPVGSIAHLISKDWWQWKGLNKLAPGREDVERELKKVEPWDTVGVACFRLANQEKLLSSRGAGLVNRVYASLYSELRERFRKELIAQVASETFALVIKDNLVEIKDRLIAASIAVEEKYESLPAIAIGSFIQQVIQSANESAGGNADLVMTHGLKFAMAALELAARQQATFVDFDLKTPGALLSILRINKEYEMLEDFYNLFRGIELHNGEMESEMALAAFTRRQYSKALEAMELAIELQPELRRHKMVKGICLVAAGEARAAADVFAMVPPVKGDPDIYNVARTVAKYAKFQSDPTTSDRAELIRSLTEVQASRSLRLLNVKQFDVFMALARVRNRTAELAEG